MSWRLISEAQASKEVATRVMAHVRPCLHQQEQKETEQRLPEHTCGEAEQLPCDVSRYERDTSERERTHRQRLVLDRR